MEVKWKYADAHALTTLKHAPQHLLQAFLHYLRDSKGRPGNLT